MVRAKVVVMLPALNEEESIGKVIDDIPFNALHDRGYDTTAVVVDGNSTDRTLDIAREKGAKVIVQRGRGKGAGVRQAFALCHPPEVVPEVLAQTSSVCQAVEDLFAMLATKYLVMLDADGTYPPRHILDIISALEEGADVAMGSRLRGDIREGAMTRLNFFGNIMLSNLASMLYQRRCTDLCTGMWGFSANALNTLELDSRHFELEAEMFAESAKKGLHIVEVPITYLPREGETKLVPLKAGFTILNKLLQRRFYNADGAWEMKTTDRAEKAPAPLSFQFL
ncbi:MAG: glycosyltransferase [Euryarchaeota archaeon]|nr:glycosyltransferase [Euryarchaeota archaeon]